MADTDKAVNLMRHAADLLDAADPTNDYLELLNRLRSSDDEQIHMASMARVIAARANAIATLRLVAAALERGAPEETP